MSNLLKNLEVKPIKGSPEGFNVSRRKPSKREKRRKRILKIARASAKAGGKAAKISGKFGKRLRGLTPQSVASKFKAADNRTKRRFTPSQRAKQLKLRKKLGF